MNTSRFRMVSNYNLYFSVLFFSFCFVHFWFLLLSSTSRNQSRLSLSHRHCAMKKKKKRLNNLSQYINGNKYILTSEVFSTVYKSIRRSFCLVFISIFLASADSRIELLISFSCGVLYRWDTFLIL